jgi:hypothetical protein
VLDKFVRPADSFDRGVDNFIVQQFDNREAKTILKDVILKGADDLGICC